MGWIEIGESFCVDFVLILSEYWKSIFFDSTPLRNFRVKWLEYSNLYDILENFFILNNERKSKVFFFVPETVFDSEKIEYPQIIKIPKPIL